MNTNLRYWLKPGITLILLGGLTYLAPARSIDPWNLLSPKKIATMVMALTFIQVLGSALAKYLGDRTGAILTGFFGGLVSSTATSASLARKSRLSKTSGVGESLMFLSATVAMLIEGIAILVSGAANLSWSTLLVFVGPLVASIVMIVLQYRSSKDRSVAFENPTFQILPILKLSVFILAILTLSKICQNLFGQNGLLVITSLVSLFEVHGSIIANVQLHESGSISARFLSGLLAVSVAASCVSKLFLISTLGSPTLKSYVIKGTVVLIASLVLGWAAALTFA